MPFSVPHDHWKEPRWVLFPKQQTLCTIFVRTDENKLNGQKSFLIPNLQGNRHCLGGKKRGCSHESVFIKTSRGSWLNSIQSLSSPESVQDLPTAFSEGTGTTLQHCNIFDVSVTKKCTLWFLYAEQRFMSSKVWSRIRNILNQTFERNVWKAGLHKGITKYSFWSRKHQISCRLWNSHGRLPLCFRFIDVIDFNLYFSNWMAKLFNVIGKTDKLQFLQFPKWQTWE